MKQYLTGKQEAHIENFMQINIADINQGIQQAEIVPFLFSHVLVINNTNHNITIFRDISLSISSMIGRCARYSTISFPIPSSLKECFIQRSGGALPGEIGFVYFTTFPPGVSGNFGQVITAGEMNIQGRRGSLIDRSGSIITAGVSQQIAPANLNRNFFMFQNLSVNNIHINFGAAATTGSNSYRITENGSISFEFFVPVDFITVISPTAGSLFTAKEG